MELNSMEYDPVKNNTVKDNEKPKKLYKSLKSVVKEANQNFIKNMEDSYADESAKTSTTGVKLAEVYLEGRRVPKDLNRAVEILQQSSSLEAKFKLLELAYKNQYFADVYHFAEFFNISKCVCELLTIKMNSKKHSKTEKLEVPSKAFAILELNKNECFKHQVDGIIEEIQNELDEKQAKKLYMEGINANFVPACYQGFA